MEWKNRKLPRLKGYDYGTAGYYYLTLCTDDKRCLFGTICEGAISLNELGRMAKNELLKIEQHFPSVSIDQYVIMPNHLHVILVIDPTERSRPFPTNAGANEKFSNPTVSTVVGLYKAGVTRLARERHPGIAIWQKSFYDHVIRDEKGYQKICEYIADNPLKWQEDEYHV